MSLAPSCESPDGRFVACVEHDAVMIRDVESWRQVAELKGHKRSVTAVEFSRDGMRIVTSSLDKTARIWDAASGAEIAVLRGHTKGVNHAAFSPDGGRVVTSSSDGTSRVWDSAGGASLLTLEHHGVGQARIVAIVTHVRVGLGLMLAMGNCYATALVTIHVATGPSGREELSFLIVVCLFILWTTFRLKTFYDECTHRAFIDADGTRVLTRSERGGVRVWDMTSGRQVEGIDERAGAPSIVASFKDGFDAARPAEPPGRPGNAP